MLKILAISSVDAEWNKAADFAAHCSWSAGAFLADMMRNDRFLEWERVFVAVEGDDIVGFCDLTEKDEMPDGYDFTPFIGFVFVDEAHRGRRISEQMIDCASGHAASLGYDKVYVMSGEEGLYEKFGFTPLDEYKTIYGWTDRLFVRATASSASRSVDESV